MPRIRLLTSVAGDLADGIPAPAPGQTAVVDQTVADLWCDGERAELVEDEPAPRDVAAEVAAVHAGAREYLAAVEAQHAERVAALEAELVAARTPRGRAKA